jgi:hypothetical protein
MCTVFVRDRLKVTAPKNDKRYNIYCGISAKNPKRLIRRCPLLGYGTINSDTKIKYVASHNVTNGSTTGNSVLCGSVPTVKSCNNKEFVGSSVLC